MTARRLSPINCFTVLLVLSLSQLLASAETRLKPPATHIPTTYFGLHVHRASETNWPSMPIGAYRLWDSFVTWSDIEPQKGQWDFKKLDNDMALAEAHNADVMLTLGQSPKWASARPSEGTVHPGGPAEPRDIDDWRNYVRTVATRYKGRIHEYEVWNEPNGHDFFTGGVAQLVRLSQEAYPILHEVDPSVIVVGPSPSPGGGTAFVEDYLRQGGGKYVDAIGYHFYVTPRPPEGMVDDIGKVKEIMARYGQGGKPLWDTETGYFIQSQTIEVKPSGPFVVLAPDQAMAYIARAHILNWAAGVTRLYWYGWDDGYQGLAESKGTMPKPVAGAYAQIEKWLTGAVMTYCVSNADAAGTWVCAIQRDGGYVGHLVWNPGGSRSLKVPADWGAQTERDLSGGVSSLRGAKEIQVGIKPVLVENKAQ
jgi:hypothetical protein